MAGRRKNLKLSHAVVAGLIFLGGAAVFIYLLITGIYSLDESLIHLRAPGRQEMNLPQDGLYTVYWEVTDQVPAVWPKDLTFRVFTPDGKEIPVAPARGEETYQFGRRHGVAWQTFKLDSPGRYSIITTSQDIPPGQTIDLTVGRELIWRIIRLVITGLAILFGSIAAGTVFLIVVIVRERRRPQVDLGLPPPIE